MNKIGTTTDNSITSSAPGSGANSLVECKRQAERSSLERATNSITQVANELQTSNDFLAELQQKAQTTQRGYAGMARVREMMARGLI